MTHSHSIRLWQGSLSIGAVPDTNALTSLATEGVSHIGCCLTEHEIPASLPAEARRAGLAWLWLPFTLPDLGEPSDTHFLRQYLSSLRQVLRQRGQVYIFCDDERTRCVLLVYALFLNAGMSASSAYSALCEMADGHVHHTHRAQLSLVSQLHCYD